MYCCCMLNVVTVDVIWKREPFGGKTRKSRRTRPLLEGSEKKEKLEPKRIEETPHKFPVGFSSAISQKARKVLKVLPSPAELSSTHSAVAPTK